MKVEGDGAERPTTSPEGQGSGASEADRSFDEVLDRRTDDSRAEERTRERRNRKERRRERRSERARRKDRREGAAAESGRLQFRKDLSRERRSYRMRRHSTERADVARGRRIDGRRRRLERREDSPGVGRRETPPGSRSDESGDSTGGRHSPDRTSDGRRRLESPGEPPVDRERGDRSATADGIARRELRESVPADGDDRVDQVREIAREIVRAVRVGTDQTRRRVVLVDVETPGGEEVRVRLRRSGEGFEAKLRSQSEALSRRLRRNRDRLREAAAERGVQLTTIDVC